MAGRIAYYGNTVTNGLVFSLDAAKRDSYPGSGTAWRDISESNRSATITSPVFTTEGGGGFTSGLTSYPSVTQANPTQLTLEVTLRIVATVNFEGYLRYGDPGSSLTDRITFRGTSGNLLQIYVYGNTTVGSTLVNLGAYNVSTTKILTTSLDNLGVGRFYINGGLVQSSTVTNFTSWQIATSTGILYANYYSSLKVYNRALSAQEVLQNYNAQKSRYGL
jgi:hypothetical protein